MKAPNSFALSVALHIILLLIISSRLEFSNFKMPDQKIQVEVECIISKKKNNNITSPTKKTKTNKVKAKRKPLPKKTVPKKSVQKKLPKASAMPAMDQNKNIKKEIKKNHIINKKTEVNNKKKNIVKPKEEQKPKQQIDKKNIIQKAANQQKQNSKTTHKKDQLEDMLSDIRAGYEENIKQEQKNKLETENQHKPSNTEKNIIHNKIMNNWFAPANIMNMEGISIILKLQLARDGSVSSLSEKKIRCMSLDEQSCRIFLESAYSAVYSATPIKELDPERYQHWSIEWDIEFTPKI